MLTIRKRGRVWHARGTVKAAGKSVYLQECSTGETSESRAWKWAQRKEVELENDLREGRPLAARSLQFADVAGRIADSLTARNAYQLTLLTEHFGDKALVEITAADWGEFARTRGVRSKKGRTKGQLVRPATPATLERYLYVFRLVFKDAAADGIPMLEIGSQITVDERRRAQRTRWLSVAEADKLIEAYDDRVRPIAVTLRYQGFRAQECLQLDRRRIDMKARTIFVGQSKNGYARTVPMHERTYRALLPLMKAKRAPFERDDGSDIDALFLTNHDAPYPDTRDMNMGIPMRSAHAGACRRAGIADFVIHDWRRHWACWLLKSGVDPWTLMKLGGWSNLVSIEPYVRAAAGDLKLQAAALAKVA